MRFALIGAIQTCDFFVLPPSGTRDFRTSAMGLSCRCGARLPAFPVVLFSGDEHLGCIVHPNTMGLHASEMPWKESKPTTRGWCVPGVPEVPVAVARSRCKAVLCKVAP